VQQAAQGINARTRVLRYRAAQIVLAINVLTSASAQAVLVIVRENNAAGRASVQTVPIIVRECNAGIIVSEPTAPTAVRCPSNFCPLQAALSTDREQSHVRPFCFECRTELVSYRQLAEKFSCGVLCVQSGHISFLPVDLVEKQPPTCRVYPV
jgi:hypothetical protein